MNFDMDDLYDKYKNKLMREKDSSMDKYLLRMLIDDQFNKIIQPLEDEQKRSEENEQAET